MLGSHQIMKFIEGATELAALVVAIDTFSVHFRCDSSLRLPSTLRPDVCALRHYVYCGRQQ